MTNGTNGHALRQAYQRLSNIVRDPTKLLELAKSTHNQNRHQAIRVAVLQKQYGDTKGDIYSRQSNGEEVWVICRQGKLATIMFRRSTQPKVADSFSVQDVIDTVGGVKLLHSQNNIDWRR
jgi:hypothetical protein